MYSTFLLAAHHAESVAAGAHVLALTVAGQLSPTGSTLATARLAQLDEQAGQARAAYVASVLTRSQSEEIIRLLNDPRLTSTDKNCGMLRLPSYTQATASEVITTYKRLINARAGYVVFAEVAAYAVVGEAFQVSAA